MIGKGEAMLRDLDFYKIVKVKRYVNENEWSENYNFLYQSNKKI